MAACFLMISEVTGESKGYGLVKYITSEAAAQAKHLLTGKEVGNRAAVHTLPVLWIRIVFMPIRIRILVQVGKS